MTHRADTLGQYLEQVRGDLSHDRAAARIGTTRHTWIRWEKDQMTPRAGYREKLIQSFNLPADAFDRFVDPARTPRPIGQRIADLEQVVARIERHLFGSDGDGGP